MPRGYISAEFLALLNSFYSTVFFQLHCKRMTLVYPGADIVRGFLRDYLGACSIEPDAYVQQYLSTTMESVPSEIEALFRVYFDVVITAELADRFKNWHSARHGDGYEASLSEDGEDEQVGPSGEFDLKLSHGDVKLNIPDDTAQEIKDKVTEAAQKLNAVKQAYTNSLSETQDAINNLNDNHKLSLKAAGIQHPEIQSVLTSASANSALSANVNPLAALDKTLATQAEKIRNKIIERYKHVDGIASKAEQFAEQYQITH